MMHLGRREGISLWEMGDITGLSFKGEYYEEVVPSFWGLCPLC